MCGETKGDKRLLLSPITLLSLGGELIGTHDALSSIVHTKKCALCVLTHVVKYSTYVRWGSMDMHTYEDCVCAKGSLIGRLAELAIEGRQGGVGVDYRRLSQGQEVDSCKLLGDMNGNFY